MFPDDVLATALSPFLLMCPVDNVLTLGFPVTNPSGRRPLFRTPADTIYTPFSYAL
jgi:hypothetical protein